MSLTFKDGTVLDFQNQSALFEYIRVTADTASTAYSMDTVWVIICAGMVFLMQMGFALVEVGTVRIKNTKNILVKNMLDACIGALSFWLIGYALAFGDTTSGFIGTNGFALKTLDMRRGGEFNDRPYQGKKYAIFLFQWAFAATAATIVSGAVAERCKVIAYFVYSFVLTVFVYPVVVHWGWSDNGWASAFAPKEDRLFGVGVIDFAGSSVVHMVGGLTALIGAIFLGPRYGKFVEGKAQTMVFQSSTFQTLGTLVLWFGWYGFNCGSTLTIAGAASDVAGKVAVTTTIGAASAGVTATVIGFIFEGHISIGRTNNGILAGLVSITAGCSVVDVEMAFLIGVIGAIVYYSASKLLTCLHIDDVVDASQITSRKELNNQIREELNRKRGAQQEERSSTTRVKELNRKRRKKLNRKRRKELNNKSREELNRKRRKELNNKSEGAQQPEVEELDRKRRKKHSTRVERSSTGREGRSSTTRVERSSTTRVEELDRKRRKEHSTRVERSPTGREELNRKKLNNKSEGAQQPEVEELDRKRRKEHSTRVERSPTGREELNRKKLNNKSREKLKGREGRTSTTRVERSSTGRVGRSSTTRVKELNNHSRKELNNQSKEELNRKRRKELNNKSREELNRKRGAQQEEKEGAQQPE
ncbi:uncharacterized protein LOC134813224 [Bolinopsis microptera]|uniref:uncharacterized protein LOC134813224 n=1 Tax=Bolinopsis microptera TaxID=2820187 RepID=UPI003078E422